MSKGAENSHSTTRLEREREAEREREREAEKENLVCTVCVCTVLSEHCIFYSVALRAQYILTIYTNMAVSINPFLLLPQ